MNLQDLKKEFFVYRNGIVADIYRRAGDPHTLIFGIDVARLSEIGRRIGRNHSLGRELWTDSKCRESRLLACWLLDPAVLTADEAAGLAADTLTTEESDIMSFRLLRHLPYAAVLAETLAASPDAPSQRTAAALLRNLQG